MLKEELMAFGKEMSENAPLEVLQTMGSEINKLAASDIMEKALKKGDTIQDFELQDSEGNMVSLNSLLAKGPAVLSFNRGNWCPFCNIEFKHLQNTLKEIKQANANLVVISPQLPQKSAELKQNNGYDFTILYDKGNQVAESFGISFVLSEVLRPIHEAFQMDIPAHNGDSSFKLPVPATYVVNSDKKIIYSFINPNWMERADPAEFLESL
jgi:peroxiredoxin